MKKVNSSFERVFESFTEKMVYVMGHSVSFLVAMLIVIAWIGIDIITSSSVHNLINDIIFSFTFLMVFIIQKMQNKFSTVMNIKLNELVASHENASNRLIKVEDLTEEELHKLAAHYEKLSSTPGKDETLIKAVSIEHVIDEIKEEEQLKEDKERKDQLNAGKDKKV